MDGGGFWFFIVTKTTLAALYKLTQDFYVQILFIKIMIIKCLQNIERKKHLDELRKGIKEVKKTYWNKWSLFLLISLLNLKIVVSFLGSVPKTYVSVSLWFMLITYLLFTIKNSWKSKSYPKEIEIFVIPFIFGMTLVHLSASVNEPYISAILISGIILYAYSFFFSLASATLYKALKRENHIFIIVLTYLQFIGSAILLFTVFYIFASSSTSYLMNTLTNDRVTEFNDIIYYSSSNFFTSAYGDIIPVGNRMRALSQFQVIISFVVHGVVISKLVPKRTGKPK